MVALDEVLITAELESRPARAPDHQAESRRLLLALSKVMADAPRQILEHLVETAAELCRADAAGISLLEAGDGDDVFRWHAIAGRYASHLRGLATREFSPCGLTVNCNAPQLLRYPHRHFTYLEHAEPRIVEGLLIPFRVNGQSVGAIWLLSHEEDRKFDAEDVRVLTDLAEFCAAALHAVHEVMPATIAATVAEKLIEAHPPVREAIERQAQATDRRVAAARREGERTAEMLLQNITDYAVMMLDEEGNIAAWNEGAARMKGYTAAEIIGQHVSIFYPPEELALGRPQTELSTARASDRSEVEGYRVKKDGSRFWANEIITRIRDAAGTPVGFAKISRDLTVQKAMQDALRESEERSRLLVENARDYAIVMLDPEGTIGSWNTGAERVFGYASGEIIGQKSEVLFTPEDRETGESAKELATAASEGRAIDERWQVRKGGERFFASGVTTPMRDTDGTLRGFAKICRDLTERQQISEQRERLLTQEQEARLEAERAIRLKDEFLAMVSHELRTPLTAILLWSKLLRIGAVDEAVRPEAIDSIEQSAIAQQHLVDDLIDVSRMVSGKMRLNVQEMELWPALEAAIETVRPMAEAKAIQLSVSLDKKLGLMRVDTERMQQVVWNLLTNAVKFTDRGGRVSVVLERAGENAHIRVSDNGIGISSDFLPHVFEVFRQADSGTTRLHGGLGLGMAITRQIVELHGGVIHVESAGQGKGATFIVTLPIASQATNGSIVKSVGNMFDTSRIEPVLAGVRVLLVEDEHNTRLVLGRLLQACKAEVTAVGSAAQAVAAFRQAERDGRFDVIVSDIGMPIEDGFELMRELRAMETQSPRVRRTPAVALTAYARAEDRARALTAGYQLYLSKPVDPAELVTVIATLAEKSVD